MAVGRRCLTADVNQAIGLVSGEDIAVDQALRVLPWSKSVVVDKAEKTYTSGSQSIRYLSQGRNQLRQAAESAVLASDSMKPLKLEGTLDFEAEFRSQELADKFNTWSFAQKGRMVSWRSDNIIAGFDNLNKLVFFPKENLPDPENHTDAVPPVLSHQTHLLEYVLYYQ